MLLEMLELADKPPTMSDALRCRHITIKLPLAFNCLGPGPGRKYILGLLIPRF